MQQTTAQEKVLGNTKSTHFKPQPGRAGCRRSTGTNTHRPAPPARNGKVKTKTGTQPHTRPSHSPARIWWDTGRFRTQTHPPKQSSQDRRGESQIPKPRNTPHKPEPAVARYKWSGHTNTHIPTPQPGLAGWESKPEPRHTHHDPRKEKAGCRRSAHTIIHTPAPQPGMAGYNQNLSPSTHTHTAQPSEDWRGTSGAGTQTHTPQHPRQEWRSAAETRTQAHTPTPHTLARIGGWEPAHQHTHPKHSSQDWRAQSQNPNQDMHHNPDPGMAGYKWSGHTNTYTPTPQPGLAG